MLLRQVCVRVRWNKILFHLLWTWKMVRKVKLPLRDSAMPRRISPLRDRFWISKLLSFLTRSCQGCHYGLRFGTKIASVWGNWVAAMANRIWALETITLGNKKLLSKFSRGHRPASLGSFYSKTLDFQREWRGFPSREETIKLARDSPFHDATLRSSVSRVDAARLIRAKPANPRLGLGCVLSARWPDRVAEF